MSESKTIHATDFPLTDAGNGERLMARHGHKLRFVAKWNQPIVYAGTHWKVDEDGTARRLQIETARCLRRQANELAETDPALGRKLFNHAIACEGRRKITDALAMAATTKGATLQPEDLDADKWLLNCHNGTIDLRSGKIQPHNPADLITKIVPVPYIPGRECPIFTNFLDRVLDGNSTLIQFIQRMVGYALSGITSERAVFILHGGGCNGKSTLLGTIRSIMADYATQVPPAALMVKHHGDGIPNDIARLKGSRFVTASESDEGQRINESLIKQMAGGEDVLTARFMRGEFFDFKPEFKIFLATNHRPEIRGTDPAIWDRIKLIPFNVRISDEERDLSLPEKLQTELPGILSWAIQGCLLWQKQGLGVPTEVKAAIADYRREMDQVAEFIAERCVTSPSHKCLASTLYDAYRIWRESNGDEYVTQTRFGRKLEEKGFKTVREPSGRKARVGISLSSEQLNRVSE